jgi:hypothetical protein
MYGNGASEMIIGEILREGGFEGRPTIATKFAPLPYRFSAKSLLKAVDRHKVSRPQAQVHDPAACEGRPPEDRLGDVGALQCVHHAGHLQPRDTGTRRRSSERDGRPAVLIDSIWTIRSEFSSKILFSSCPMIAL